MREVPTLRLLTTPKEELRGRAEALAVKVRSVPGVAKAEVREESAFVGGGSLPGYGVPSWAVHVAVLRAQSIAARLRTGNPSVFCRVEDDMLAFDLRTVPPEEDERLLRAIRYALEQG